MFLVESEYPLNTRCSPGQATDRTQMRSIEHLPAGFGTIHASYSSTNCFSGGAPETHLFHGRNPAKPNAGNQSRIPLVGYKQRSPWIRATGVYSSLPQTQATFFIRFQCSHPEPMDI